MKERMNEERKKKSDRRKEGRQLRELDFASRAVTQPPLRIERLCCQHILSSSPPSMKARTKLKAPLSSLPPQRLPPSTPRALAPNDALVVPNGALQPVHIAELDLFWAADKRMPSLASRRAWAAARSVNSSAVNVWFQRKRYCEGRRRGGRLPGGTYDLQFSATTSLPTGQTSNSEATAVKEEIPSSPGLPAIKKAARVGAGPVRHTRAHDSHPNLRCLICSQRYLDAASNGQGFLRVTQESSRREVEVKRERAASPVLSELPPAKRPRTLPPRVRVKQEEMLLAILDRTSGNVGESQAERGTKVSIYAQFLSGPP